MTLQENNQKILSLILRFEGELRCAFIDCFEFENLSACGE
jgi:hypothetical protein